MEARHSSRIKNLLSVTSLLLSLAALQGPLWRPHAAPRYVTAKVGGTAVLTYDGAIQRASIFEKRTASLSTGGPHQILIHGHAPGRTSLMIVYQNGERALYRVVVLPRAM